VKPRFLLVTVSWQGLQVASKLTTHKALCFVLSLYHFFFHVTPFIASRFVRGFVMQKNHQRSIQALTLTAVLTIPLLTTPTAQAAPSGDECAIWMCLPTGFITGCSGARKAFLKRIKKFKPPLPSFTSCLVSSPASATGADTFTSDYGVAAYIPPQQICTQYEQNFKDGYRCVAWRTEPEQYIKKRSCYKDNNGYSSPKNCTHTVRYTEVYRNGVLFGQPHYY